MKAHHEVTAELLSVSRLLPIANNFEFLRCSIPYNALRPSISLNPQSARF